MEIVPGSGEKGGMYQDQAFGDQLRDWRQRRRLSQLDLAAEAELSTRHLSFVETGRAKPSREMVLRLAEALELPLRSRNALLIAAGYAPSFPERPLEESAQPEARLLVQRILDAHMPFPAIAVDRHWHLVMHNKAAGALMAGVAAHLIEPPVNVLRLSIHPEGLAPRIANLADWKRHILERLRHQYSESGDAVLEELIEELRAYPAPASKTPSGTNALIALPMILDSPVGQLSFISTTTVFGTPVEVTMSELAIESFFPADGETAERLRMMAAHSSSRP
ncbi:MAG TPA: helix-turn-helix transcriptional regulator [Sphingomicrobium sp.]|nr:helix-turn-helix transcriptional regulator [Sphingomicrobium sp.]